MDKHKQERLRVLFGKVNLEEPSKGFEERLMLQVHEKAKEQIRKKAFRNKLYVSFSIAGAVIGMVSIPFIILNYLGLQIEIEPINLNLSGIQFNPFVISVFLIILSLLVGDTLIRKHISDKKHKEQDS